MMSRATFRTNASSITAPLFMNTDYLLKEEFISHDLSDIHYNVRFCMSLSLQ
jgi:hypothetical protein